MKLAIFGGSGATGRLVIDRAVEAGHEVTALVRRPESLEGVNGHVRIVPGRLDDRTAMDQTVGGSDAVVSALGSRDGRRPTMVYSQGIAAVLVAEARRIVAVSAVPAAPDEGKTFLERRLVHPLLGVFFGGGYADMRRMEELLTVSETEWTVLRPPRLTNGPAKGTYRKSTGHLSRPSSISRADLAAAMLAAVEDAGLVRQFVTVSY